MTFRKNIRNQQPQTSLRINSRFNPVHAFLPSYPVDLIRGVPISRQSNTEFIASGNDYTLKGTSSSSATKVTFGSNGLSDYVGTTGPVTYLARFKLNTLGINQFIMCSMDSSGFEGVCIQINSSNSLILSWRDQSGGLTRTITGPTVSSSEWYNVVLTTDPSWGIYGYVNGKPITPNTTTDVARRDTGRVSYLGPGEYPNDFWNSDANIAFGAVLRLDARNVGSSISLNPWQLFIPTKQFSFIAGVATASPKILKLKKPRFSQPQTVPEINRSIFKAQPNYLVVTNNGMLVDLMGNIKFNSIGNSKPGIAGIATGETTGITGTCGPSALPKWTTQSLSIGFYGYLKGDGSQGGRSMLIIGSSGYGLNLRFNNYSTNFLQVMAGGYWSGGGVSFTTSVYADNITPVYIIVTFDRANSLVTLYVNGKLREQNNSIWALDPGTMGSSANVYFNQSDTIAKNSTLYQFTVPYAMTSAEVENLYANPWEVFKQTNTLVIPAPISVSVYRPGSDVAVSGWSAIPSGALYATINETVADDVSYASSPDLFTPATMGLDNPMPIGTYDIKVRFKSNAAGQVRINLLDASNTTVGTSAWQSATSSFATYTLSVTTTAIATKFKIEVQ